MKIYSLSKSVSLATKIAKHLGEPLNVIMSQQFADGEVSVEFKESVRNEDLIIVAHLQMPYDNLMELIFACDAAKRNDAKKITVIIPYLPHSRQERRDKKRTSISARVIADMLQNAGVDHVISMDLHIGAIEGFYKIPFEKLSPIEIFVEEIKKLNIDDMILVSPDFGFIKKMEEYQVILDVDMAVIKKDRKNANKVDKMRLIGDVNGKNVVIIDDIIDTAGTLVKASDLMFEKGALSVTVFATHGVLSGNYSPQSDDNAIERIAASKIKNVYISNTFQRIDVTGAADDTRQHVMSALSMNKIKIVDVSSVFADAVKKLIIN